MISKLHNGHGTSLLSHGVGNRLTPVFDRLLEDFVSATPHVGWNGFPTAMWEDENAVFFEMDIPGIPEELLDVTIHGEDLLIRGERKAPDGRRQDQRFYGKFEQRVTLPALVDLGQIEARLNHGVLSLRLPKSEAAKPFRIALNGSADRGQLAVESQAKDAAGT